MRKHIHRNQPIGLPLTAEERKLLMADDLIIDDDYLNRIKDAPADKPEIPFTLDELDDFCGNVASNANHEKSRKRQKALDVIFGKIQHLLEAYTDEEEPEGKSAEVESRTPALNPLHMMMAQFEAMGLNVETLAKNMTPKAVATDEMIPVSMSAAEKELVLTLAGIREELKERIRQTPPKKRTVLLTLREVNELEPLVAAAEKSCPDKKLARKWSTIDYHLHDVQMHYSDGTEPSDALEQGLAGKPVSTGAAVRGLFMKMLEERKKTQAGKGR